MRVIGIDPGLTRCGVGIVDGTVGRPPQLVAVGIVRTPADLDVARRLLALEEGLAEWFDRYRPEVRNRWQIGRASCRERVSSPV